MQRDSSAGSTRAGPERRSRDRRSAGLRRSSRTEATNLLVAACGLLLCIGVFSAALPPQQFRIFKHLFYALIAILLLLDYRAAARLARRDPWIWAMMGLMCVSALWSDFPGWALKRGLVTLQTTTFGLYLALRLSLDDQVRLLMWMLIATFMANVAYLVLSPESAFMLYAGERAFMGFLGHKNAVGHLSALALPIFLLEARSRGIGRWPALVGIGTAATLLVLSRSLTGTIVGLTLCMIVVLQPLSRKLRRPALLLLPPAALTMVAIAAMGGLTDEVLILLGRDPTLTGRTDIWREAIPVILERPLLGHSIASFWQLDIVSDTFVWFSNAHNGYLQLTIELGILGLAIFVLQLASMFLHSLRWHVRQVGRGAIWPICMASSFVLYNHFEVVLMRENSLAWVLVVATSLGVRRAAARSRRSTQSRDASEVQEAKG